MSTPDNPYAPPAADVGESPTVPAPGTSELGWGVHPEPYDAEARLADALAGRRRLAAGRVL